MRRERIRIISGEAGYMKRKGVNPGGCYDRSLEPKIFSVRGRPSHPHANRKHFRLRRPRHLALSRLLLLLPSSHA